MKKNDSSAALPFRYLDHVADTRFIAFGKTREEAFANAARAMFCVIADDADLSAAVSFPVNLTSPDLESLLVDWLSELLFLFDAEGILFSRFDVASIAAAPDGSYRLTAAAAGEPLDLTVHNMKTEVKAVTYNGLRVEEKDGCWEAEVVLDL